MKKLMLLFSIFVSVNVLHAQIAEVQPVLPKQPFGFKSKVSPGFGLADTTIIGKYRNLYSQGLKNKQANVDNMPVVGKGEVILTWQSNNSQHFDLYSATSDNMTVLKPDSTVFFAIPNGFNKPAWPVEKH